MKGGTLALMICWALSGCNAKHSPEVERPSHFAAEIASASYYLVRSEQTWNLGTPAVLLRHGFGVTVVRGEHSPEGEIAITRSGMRVPFRHLKRAQPSRFSGIELHGGELGWAWIRHHHAPIWAHPSPTASPIGYERRLARVRLHRLDGPEGYYNTTRGWMRAMDLRIPTQATRPASVQAGERWIDVDLDAQTLVAYEGDRPVYATLVSAGVGRPGSPFATPVGEQRITAKLMRTQMSNLAHTQVVPYFYEEVPYTQYIGRVALHGVYWHDRFGERQSHGCINLSLSDAAWLYAFTHPRLNRSGEVDPYDGERTLVRVH